MNPVNPVLVPIPGTAKYPVDQVKTCPNNVVYTTQTAGIKMETLTNNKTKPTVTASANVVRQYPELQDVHLEVVAGGYTDPSCPTTAPRCWGAGKMS